MAFQPFFFDVSCTGCGVFGFYYLQLRMVLQEVSALRQCYRMRVDFGQCAPVFAGQAHNAVADTQFVFAYDGGSAITKQFIVMEQATRNGIFDCHHSEDAVVLLHFGKHFFECVATNQFNGFILKVFVGRNVVIRAQDSLYGYFFHFQNALNKKIPSSFRKRDFVSFFSLVFSLVCYRLTYAYKLPLHFIAKVKVIKEKEEVCSKCFHTFVLLVC